MCVGAVLLDIKLLLMTRSDFLHIPLENPHRSQIPTFGKHYTYATHYTYLYISELTRRPTLGSYVLYNVLVCCRIISKTCAVVVVECGYECQMKKSFLIKSQKYAIH